MNNDNISFQEFFKTIIVYVNEYPIFTGYWQSCEHHEGKATQIKNRAINIQINSQMNSDNISVKEFSKIITAYVSEYPAFAS